MIEENITKYDIHDGILKDHERRLLELEDKMDTLQRTVDILVKTSTGISKDVKYLTGQVDTMVGLLKNGEYERIKYGALAAIGALIGMLIGAGIDRMMRW